MSLLNQVLQDLEKRNAEQSPIQNQLSEIKTVTNRPKPSFYFLLALFCVALIVFYFFSELYKEEDALSVIVQNTPSAKQPTDIKTSTLPKQVLLKKTKAVVVVKPIVTVKKPEPQTT